jgi:hypothetical protein
MEDLIDPENQLPKSNIPPIKKKHIEVNPLALNKNIKLNNLDLNIIDNNQKFQRKKRNISVSKTTVEKKKINLDSNENNVNDDDNNNELKNSIEHLKNLNLFDFDDKDDEKKQQNSSEQNENK